VIELYYRLIYDKGMNKWIVTVSGKAKKEKTILPTSAYDSYLILLESLENGPVTPKYPNYGKL